MQYIKFDSPRGNSGKMRGYPVKLKRKGHFPVVLAVHENRGLNSYIEDVACSPATDRCEFKENEVKFEMHIYESANHGFHNNSTPRYDEKAAKLTWERTISAFKKYLM